MKIRYDIVEIDGRDANYVAAVTSPEAPGRLGPAPSLKKLIELALTPDDIFSPRVKAAFVAIEKIAREFAWDEAKIEAALPAS